MCCRGICSSRRMQRYVYYTSILIYICVGRRICRLRPVKRYIYLISNLVYIRGICSSWRMKRRLFTICIQHLILTKRSYMCSAGWTKIGSDGWRRMKRRLFAISRVRKRRWRRKRQCERLMC